MDNFRFNLPTEVIAGRGCVRAHATAWTLGRKALIVTGKQSARVSGALEDVLAVLSERAIDAVIFDGISANPDADQVYAGAAVGEGCDFVVAIGGGSPLDAAKAIAWVLGTEVSREEFFRRVPLPSERVLPMVAVPVTCGTGSEVTPYAIITDHEEQSKVNITCSTFFPRVALLDARYLESLPLAVLCDTALDALSHAIEGAYSPRANRMTLAMSEEAIRTLMPELLRLAHGAYVNRTQLHYASMLAGMVIAQTGTALVHAMGYPLTYHKGIPHGRANGLLLAGYLEFMERPCERLTRRLLDAAGLQAPEELHALIDTLLDVMEVACEAPSEEELARFAREPLRLSMVRRYCALPSPEEVMDIYRAGF